MKIFITCPRWSVPHGGIRIILEWANRLAELHDVSLFNVSNQKSCSWFKISEKVKITSRSFRGIDCLIITSPHTISFAKRQDAPKKIFLFCQMMEHLFQPESNAGWQTLCKAFYTSPHPMICISKWNHEMLVKNFGRTAPTYIVGNGVNLEDFPIEFSNKEEKTILIEGWESNNPSKDPQHLGPKVCEMLKVDGYKIITYCARPISFMTDVPDEVYIQPDTQTLNKLYSRALIMIKASLYDARSCAPMEAMTKGTVTVRAIKQGDDDLIHLYNCIRCNYSLFELYHNIIFLLKKPDLRHELQKNGYEHLFSNSWEVWMNKINDILIA